MPYKVWQVGEEVVAGDFNPVLQEQVIATFASAVARDAAILTPRNGQHAWLIDVGLLTRYTGTAWEAATVAASTMVPHEELDVVVPTAAGNTASATYVNWPTSSANGPLSCAITKRRADTKLVVAIGGGGYPVTVAGMQFMLGVRYGSTDVDVEEWFTNQAVASPEHQYHGGMVQIAGLAAGAYTFTGKLRKTGGNAGAWQCDAADRWHLSVRETF
jgi:hypothetical protein